MVYEEKLLVLSQAGRGKRMTFRARIDKGVMGLLLAFPIASSFFNVVLDNSELFEIIMSVLIECLIVSLIISALLSVKYTLEENELVISRLGIKSTLAYVNISEIVERLGMLSFEAPSVSQVRLTKKDGTAVRISPVDVKGFISEIKKRIR
jgi:hypothetical protein